MSTMTDMSQYISLDDAAQLLGISARTLRRYIERGKLQGFQRGIGVGAPMLLRADVERLSQIVPIEPKGSDQDGE